jgi:hypothetical protein
MHIPGLVREYERTCDDCGHTWRVPKWAAHPHMQGLPMGRGGQGPGSTAASVGAAGSVVEANAALAEKVAVFKVCPECSSEQYKQRAIRS